MTKLIVFDLDGTIIDDIESFWAYACNDFGCDIMRKKQGNEKYLKNLITYDEWVEHDIALWKEKKAVKDDFLRSMKKLRLMKGTIETIKTLKKRGFKIGMISDSLDIALEALIPDYKELFDEVMINRIFFGNDGRISGWDSTEYGMEKKADGLKKMAEREKIGLKDCIFVGDGFNDVHAVKLAGMGISFNSHSEELDKAADVIIKKKDLREILKYIS